MSIDDEDKTKNGQRDGLASLLSNMTCRRHCGSARITQHGPWLQTVSQPVGEEDLFTMMAKAKGAG